MDDNTCPKCGEVYSKLFRICRTCHGPMEDISPDVSKLIDDHFMELITTTPTPKSPEGEVE